ncbi:MAG: glycosyltransferase [Cyanobacteriota bacterium]|jgi:glycosyltransferase involved in cell wall biosynthesis
MIREAKPFFSVVTISYNQGAYLPDCLSSVREQDFGPVEHIVVDPGSCDQSIPHILQSIPSDLAILEPDAGPADGLNKGFEKARGDYVLFINADDFLLPGALSRAYTLLRQHHWPDLLLLGGIVLREENGTQTRVFPGSTVGWIQALGLSHFFQQGLIIKLNTFRHTTAFNLRNKTCWDMELLHQVASLPNVRICRAKNAIAAFRIHSTSISGSGRMEEEYCSDLQRIARTFYGKKLVIARSLLQSLPSLLLKIMKYLLDPRLAFWMAKASFRQSVP